ncbi:hypothetical protein EDB83DRAFT_575975 [Lactarius deliciosus]|nr:hypothetical protein EDB83DRAFT_575975 [Lactarius deliciosus]
MVRTVSGCGNGMHVVVAVIFVISHCCCCSLTLSSMVHTARGCGKGLLHPVIVDTRGAAVAVGCTVAISILIAVVNGACS